MHKERSEGSDITNPVVFELDPFPSVPRLGWQRMRRGSQSQKVQHHQFAVVVPAILQKPTFRSPSVRQYGRVFREPIPINSVEDFKRQLADFGLWKILSAGEVSAKDDSRFDGGNLCI